MLSLNINFKSPIKYFTIQLFIFVLYQCEPMHTDVSHYFPIFAEIFFSDLSDIFLFLPIIWTNVGCKKCNLSIQSSPKKGAIWLKMGSGTTV